MEQKRIQLLDYMKAVCVIMVIITHYDWADKSSPFFTMLINMAVPVFMILSGYNFAMSNRKKTGGKFVKMYEPHLLEAKLERFLVPFFVICLVEIALIVYEGKHLNLFRIFAYGAYGPGSYYVPILIQLILIFPVIYKMIEKNAKLGLTLAAAANLLFEIMVHVTDMDKYYYRLLIGRYILLIAFGCYLYLHPEQRLKKHQMVAMMFIGLSYIYVILWLDRDPALFQYWTPTAMPIAFYIFPIVVLIFRRFYHSSIPGVPGRVLALLGQASYHIFLVQMVYYHFELGGILMKLPIVAAIGCNIVICCGVGVLFYEADLHISKKVKALIRDLKPHLWRKKYAV
ncbi:MAG: acyltransferase family protein [Roseburia sp.]